MMKMIDVGSKPITAREAVVNGKIRLKESVIIAIKKKRIPKGDVIETAKLAGILGAKKNIRAVTLMSSNTPRLC